MGEKENDAPLNFSSTLENLEGVYKGTRNDLNVLVDDALQETVKRVLSTGKVGKMTVVLAFSRKDDDRIEVKGDVKTSLPEPKSDTKTFYHDSRGNLFVEDIRQAKLPFPTPLKKVGGNTSA